MDTGTARTYLKELEKKNLVLKGKWLEESYQIAEYLTTLNVPSTITDARKVRRFKAKALNHLVKDGALWLRPTDHRKEPRRVVDSAQDRFNLFKAFHDKCRHKGRTGTYRRFSDFYYWKGMYRDVEN